MAFRTASVRLVMVCVIESMPRQTGRKEAIRLTGVVAENRRMSLLRTLTRQRDRLARMVDVASGRCGAMTDAGERSACYVRSAESLSTKAPMICPPSNPTSIRTRPFSANCHHLRQDAVHGVGMNESNLEAERTHFRHLGATPNC